MESPRLPAHFFHGWESVAVARLLQRRPKLIAGTSANVGNDGMTNMVGNENLHTDRIIGFAPPL